MWCTLLYGLFDASIIIRLADVLIFFVPQIIISLFDYLSRLADTHYYVIPTTWSYLSYLLWVAYFNPYFV